MDKLRLRTAIIEKLQGELENVTRAAMLARDEATHEESKPENQYDMHAQEAAYLAEGQARLAAELSDTLALYQSLSLAPWEPTAPVGIGAVVTLDASPHPIYYFVGPRSGGLEIKVDGKDITVVTPASPLGRQLVGAKVDTKIQLPGKNKNTLFRIVHVE